jgi:hypothetical protein
MGRAKQPDLRVLRPNHRCPQLIGHLLEFDGMASILRCGMGLVDVSLALPRHLTHAAVEAPLVVSPLSRQGDFVRSSFRVMLGDLLIVRPYISPGRHQ